MQILAVCNQKGGTGKTTTTVNLARAALTQGRRTLAIDLDPQSDLTSVLIAADDDDAARVSLADVLSPSTKVPISDATTGGVWDGLDVVPAGGDTLAQVLIEMVTMTTGGATRLRKALRPVADDYDVVLIDCAPSLDLLAVNGLVAAHAAVLVTTPELFALNGIARLLTTINHVIEDENPALVVGGVIVNNVQHTNRMRGWLEEITATMTVLSPPVQRATWIADAVERGAGLDTWGTPAATELHRTYCRYLDTILATIPA